VRRGSAAVVERKLPALRYIAASKQV
jgi:hypothetical protein